MVREKPYKGELANQLFQSMRSVHFPDVELVPVTSHGLVEQLNQKKLGIGLDFRSPANEQDGYGSVFQGLAFDPDRATSQATALFFKKQPIGIMTQVVLPKKIVSEQRYFQRVNKGVLIQDFQKINFDKIAPEFVIIPAWTKIAKPFLTRFALSGFHAFQKAFSTITAAAPTRTYAEVAVQGLHPLSQRKELMRFAMNLQPGEFVSEETLPFSLDQLGKHDPQSSSSLKLAQLIGLHEIVNVGSARSLGPIFQKRIS